VDILDPALMRSGRIDRKIEFPLPSEEARAQIMSIHTRKMTVSPDVNYDELARCTDGFNGAQCKAVCVEAVSYNIAGKPNSSFNLSGNDRPTTQRDRAEARGLHGRHSGGRVEEAQDTELLCLI